MSKKDIGESLIQIGSLMLIMPLLAFLGISILYILSKIEFGIYGLISIGIFLYLGISIGLIIYGKKLMK